MSEQSTLPLPPQLAERIAQAAGVVAQSPQDWALEALALQLDQAETLQPQLTHARQAAEAIDAGEALYAMDAVHDYLLARAAGLPGKRPHPRHLVVAKSHSDLRKE
ncbi:MAG TPA: hypothetical protein VIU93_03915 [Gallionellaceae bacterium]